MDRRCRLSNIRSYLRGARRPTPPRAGHRLAKGCLAISLACFGCPGFAGVPGDPGPAATIAPKAAPPQTAENVVAVGSLLSDPASLLAWLQARNPDLQAARARILQAEANLSQQRLYPNPGLGAMLSDWAVGETNPPGLQNPGDTAIYNTSLSETVELGKRGPRIASARLQLESERQTYLDTVAGVVADARFALARILFLRARQDALEASLAAAQENLELQRTRLGHGDLSGNDFDRLKVDTMVLESDVSANRQEYQAALSDCAAILLAPCAEGTGTLDQVGAAAPVPETPDVEAALQSRPDLKALGLEGEAARQDEILAHRRRIPDPNFILGYSHDNLTISGDQPRTLQFGFTIPLPVFDRGQHDAAKAAGRAEELEHTARADRERGRARVSALLQRKTSLEANLKMLNEGALPTSKEVMASTLAAVNQGGMSMTDLLLARRTYTELVLKVMDLQFDLFAVRNDLRRSLGLDAAEAAVGLSAEKKETT